MSDELNHGDVSQWCIVCQKLVAKEVWEASHEEPHKPEPVTVNPLLVPGPEVPGFNPPMPRFINPDLNAGDPPVVTTTDRSEQGL